MRRCGLSGTHKGDRETRKYNEEAREEERERRKLNSWRGEQAGKKREGEGT
jgi:hypothetical protein